MDKQLTSQDDPTPEERKIADNIVNGWNSIVTNFENQTIKFVQIVNKYLNQRGHDSVTRIMRTVYSNPQMKRTVSVRRIWQGLRLVNKRPELLAYHEQGQQPQGKIYLKPGGEVNWEFYFELYRYQLNDAEREDFEKKGVERGWSTQVLRKAIQAYKKKNQPIDADLKLKETFISEIKHLLHALPEERLKNVKAFIVEQLKEAKEANEDDSC